MFLVLRALKHIYNFRYNKYVEQNIQNRLEVEYTNLEKLLNENNLSHLLNLNLIKLENSLSLHCYNTATCKLISTQVKVCFRIQRDFDRVNHLIKENKNLQKIIRADSTKLEMLRQKTFSEKEIIENMMVEEITLISNPTAGFDVATLVAKTNEAKEKYKFVKIRTKLDGQNFATTSYDISIIVECASEEDYNNAKAELENIKDKEISYLEGCIEECKKTIEKNTQIINFTVKKYN